MIGSEGFAANGAKVSPHGVAIPVGLLKLDEQWSRVLTPAGSQNYSYTRNIPLGQNQVGTSRLPASGIMHVVCKCPASSKFQLLQRLESRRTQPHRHLLQVSRSEGCHSDCVSLPLSTSYIAAMQDHH